MKVSQTKCKIVCLALFLFIVPGHLVAEPDTLFDEGVIIPLRANKTHRGVHANILQLKNGTLLLAYSFFKSEGFESDLLINNPDGGIAGRTSYDLGRTWSKPFIMRTNVGTGIIHHSPGFLRLKDGNILFHYDIGSKTTVSQIPREGYYENTYVSISSDEMKTWTPHLCITNFIAGKAGAMPGSLIQISTGRIILPFDTRTPVNNVRLVSLSAYSDDGGYSWWPSKNTVDIKGRPNSGTEEPVIAELKNGDLVMLCRTFEGYLCRSYSKDHGESWSEPELVKDLPSSIPSPLDIARIPETNDLVAVWCHNPLGPERAKGKEQPVVQVAQLKMPLGNVRAPLTAAISQDAGKTWKHHRNITSDPEGVYRDYGYPSIVFVENGKIALITCNSIDGIRLARIGIEWFYGK